MPSWKLAIVVACAACGRIGFGVVGDAASPYHDLGDRARWEFFDTTPVNTAANGFRGAVFDGRYITFVPDDNGQRDGVVARYDTTQPYSGLASWEAFDLATLSPLAKGYFGGAFDGTYVYLAPFDNGMGTDGFAARLDPAQAMTTATAWSFFDVTTVDANAKGFYGLVFDGQYVYYVPDGGHGAAPVYGVAARYDTHQAYTSASAWQTFDLTTVDAAAKGFWAGAFDGTFIYFVPCFGDTGYDGVVARFDTRGPFAAAGSWSTFDVASIDPRATGFAGAAYDGAAIYLVPRYGGTVARYDLGAQLDAAGAWTTFDLTMLDASAQGFDGSVFDGRYVYLLPDSIGSVAQGTIARYDTLAPFSAATSWQTFDLASIDVRAVGFIGGAFDGRYVYLAPYEGAGNVVARFDAREPAALPAHLGSFF